MPALELLLALDGASSTTGRRQRGVAVLDMCAAPGGKLLILLGALAACGNLGRLVAVEKDRFRFNRLVQNLRLYLPQKILSRVFPIHGDASRQKTIGAGLRKHSFDGVLLDAPCSSERERVLRAVGKKDALEYSDPVTEHAALWPSVPWSAAKARANSKLQVELLCAALQYYAPLGKIVYSTCALSHIENDDVVAKALNEAAIGSEHVLSRSLTSVLFESTAVTEKTSAGWRVLPDEGGWGPIYWSLLQGPGVRF